MPLMGFREYARHRAAAGLVGGTLAAVQTAIRSGRIKDAVVEITGEPRKIDSARADQLWTERSAPSTQELTGNATAGGDHAQVTKPKPAAADAKVTAAGDAEDVEDLTYAAARAARERANARKAEMEADVMAGRLVDSEAVANAWEKIIQTSRTKVLALPSKIRTRLPQLTAANVALIESIVRDTLDELAA
jgi:phage terminase Nu1 subunit (DNA packaging protein)